MWTPTVIFTPIPPGQVHTVQSGQTLSSIARMYGTSVRQLQQNNPILAGGSEVYPGQTLVISYQQQKEGTLSVNGYAYPFIDRTLLRSTLPFLTYMTPFTYGITENGGLVARYGPSVLLNLFGVIALVYGACVVHALVVYSAAVAALGRISPLRFFKECAPAALFAFSSSSSAATLPFALDAAERLGASHPVRSFVLPLGATINMDGTADFICTDMPTALGATSTYDDLVILDFSGTDDDFVVSEGEVNIGISVAKGNTELKDAMDAALEGLTADHFNALMAQAIAVQPEI